MTTEHTARANLNKQLCDLCSKKVHDDNVKILSGCQIIKKKQMQVIYSREQSGHSLSTYAVHIE